jgi:large subunit ribosomal protein L6
MITLQQEFTALLYKNNLLLIGRTGMATVKVSHLIHKLQISISKSSLNIITFVNDKDSLILKNNLVTDIDKTLSRLTNLLRKKLLFFGIGFRCWTYKKDDLSEYIVLKIGFSRDICVKIPLSIKAVSLKPTLVLFKSLDKIKLNQFVAFLRSLKVPDSYKGKGIQYIDEKILLKAGKHN